MNCQNLTQIETQAIEILVDICTDLGEPLYVLDHNEIVDAFVDNDVKVDLTKIDEIDLDKFNEKLVAECEDALINLHL